MQAKVLKIDPNFPQSDLIKEAANVLKKGGLVAFPTETVYGIGANLLDKRAIDRLYEIKKRPKDKPFTVHISEFETLKKLKIRLSEKAERIVHKFWPGPLTIVAFNDKKEKIGLRMPRNKIALELIDKSSVPVAAPSANLSGRKPPVSADEVISGMSGVLDVIIDGGSSEVGTESTVLDVTKDPFRILRQGAISKEELLTDFHVLFVCTGNSCRSVMAKALLEKFIKQSGLSDRIKVDSAGTGGFLGIPAAENTIHVLKEEGVDVSSHKGKGITGELLKKSDMILVMERRHRDIILNKIPAAGLKVRLLKEDSDIPDPIGRSLEEYRNVLGIIKNHVENIFLELFENYK
ncbi:MAG: threonylcarbamoyl-AMP synthase [Candidatus Omnitrophica bacterium]|nr:threonylcarbamoyl-AMP synthase [Candidatus Omnitrophota bacterium]